MRDLTTVPPAKRAILHEAVNALRDVPGIAAIVLGGSHARGVAKPESDLDIGIYYREPAPPPVDRIRQAAERISTPGSIPVVTDFYGWGAWVNGGAWIQTPATRVDLLYRNLDQIYGVIEEGRRGNWRHDFDQQPPYGFRSIVYFAETFFCVPLHDPDGEIGKLQALVTPYPEPLRSRIVQEGLWGAEFSLWMCLGFADSGDVFNAAGCMTRAAHYLVHVMFALNREYFLSDKYANRFLDGFSKRPRDFTARLADLLSRPGRAPGELRASLGGLRGLWAETVTLTEGAYQPRFPLEESLARKGGN